MRARRQSAATARPVTTRPQRRHVMDYQILLYVGLIMLLGLIIMYAIGPQRAQVLNNVFNTDVYTGTYFVVRQVLSLGVATVALIFMAIVPLEWVKKYAGIVLLAGLGASVLLLFLGNLLDVQLGVTTIANCTNGACRWFDLGPLGSFQPAELVKFGLLIYMARFIAARMKDGTLNDWRESIMPILILTGVAAFFVVVVQKDLGTGLSLLAIVASMLMIAGVNRKTGVQLLAALLVVGVIMVVTAPHRVARVLTFLEGDDVSLQNVDSDGYHILQAKIALGSGGVTGVGIGNSVNATGYLPEAINDSIFAIIGETFGFIGATILILLFVALLMRLLRISERLSDPWMQLIVIGVFGWLAAHTVLNIASMIGIFPLTGITLPLLSFGGTSMVFIAAAIGLVLHTSRYTRYSDNRKEPVHETVRSGRRVGRTRDAGTRRY